MWEAVRAHWQSLLSLKLMIDSISQGLIPICTLCTRLNRGQGEARWVSKGYKHNLKCHWEPKSPTKPLRKCGLQTHTLSKAAGDSDFCLIKIPTEHRLLLSTTSHSWRVTWLTSAFPLCTFSKRKHNGRYTCLTKQGCQRHYNPILFHIHEIQFQDMND